MSRLARLAALCLLAACAAQPEGPTLESGGQIGEVGDARNRARLHTELASLYYARGNMNVALEELRIAVSADSGYAAAYGLYGLVYMELKQNPLAEQNFDRALRLAPNEPDINHNYGWYLCQNSREPESIKYFMAAVRNPLYQTPERSFVNAGMCARRRGDLAGAENYFQLALKTRPAQTQALYQMADLSYARGDDNGARIYLGRLTQVAQVGPEVLWLGVRASRRLGDRNSEASYALQLRNKFANSAETRALNAGQYE